MTDEDPVEGVGVETDPDWNATLASVAAPEDVRLERAEGADALAVVERLLAANDLPTADVRDGPGRFYLARADEEVVGAGGLEGAGEGDHALLRSIVVREGARGAGVGSWLCDALEARAGDAGVETLHLLTTTAGEFFARCGYEVTARTDAPRAIRETREFAALCPETATYMRKRLVDADAEADVSAREGPASNPDTNRNRDRDRDR